MNENGVTQLPVLEDGKSVGSIKESRLLSRLLENRDLISSPVSQIMEATFPIVDEEASIEEVTARLLEAPAVLVEEYKRIIGIITRTDILEMPK
jgi:cystathionine beta-synthase